MMLRCVLLISLVCLTSGFLVDDDSDWDYFTFAQAWPPGTCVAGIFERHNCSIPKNVQTWTNHGLWPSRTDGKGPFNCDPSEPFDISKVASIKGSLEVFWPNLYTDTAHDSFWQHEWSKHGTCCADLPATSDELKYFAQGLKLNQLYNISSMLSQSGIVPSASAQYSLNDFLNAIKKSTGFQPVIECAYKKLENGTDYHVIDQIEICLDKQFKPIACNFGKRKQQMRLKHAGTQKANTDMTGPLKYRAHSRRSSVYVHQSNCPTHYNFNYPLIKHG